MIERIVLTLFVILASVCLLGWLLVIAVILDALL